MNLRTVIYMLFMLLLAGCGEKHDPVFDRLEERVSANPDSVRTVLEEMDPEQIPSEFDRSRHAMLLMMARHKCRQPLQPDTNLYKAAEYFHKKRDLLNEAKARYYAGVAECEVGNNQGAIREALHAIDRSHEAADTFWMGRAHSLAFEIYISTYDCRNAAIEADKAAIYFKHVQSVPFHLYALLDKAQALNYPVYEDGTPSGGGMALLDSLKKVAFTNGDSSLVANCLYHQSIFSYDAKNFDLAQRQIDSISHFSKNTDLIANLLPNIILLQIAKGEESGGLLKEYWSQLKTPEDTLSYLKIKSRNEASKGNWKSAYHLADSMRIYYNMIMGDKVFRSVDEIRDIHNREIIEVQQEENVHLRFSRSVISYLALGTIVLLLLIFLLIRTRNKKKEKDIMGQLLEIAYENEDLKDKIHIQERIIAENTSLKEQLEQQHRVIEQQTYLKIRLADFDKLQSENTVLKEQLEMLKSEELSVPRHLESTTSANIQEMTNRRIYLLGNRIDTLCEMAMDYYEDSDTKTSKNIIYNRVLKELKHLKSESYLKGLECKVNEVHDNIIERFKNQLPEIAKGNTRWIALMIGGLSPQTISFLLDMKIQTLYSKRLRVRSYIEKSNAPNKNEFLLYFPKAKK